MSTKTMRGAWLLLCTIALLTDPVVCQKVTKAHDDLAKLVEKNGGKV